MNWLSLFQIKIFKSKELVSSSCRTLDTSSLLVIFAGLVFCSEVHGKIKVSYKTEKDTTKIEFSGLDDWRYQINRKAGERPVVDIQFTGVTTDEVMSLTNLSDGRVKQVEVVEGLNNGARVLMTLAPGKLELFDFNEIFDVDLESPNNMVTIGGWLTEAMGEIPKSGQKFESHGFFFQVLSSDVKRIKRLYIRQLSKGAK